jgi:signal peptidase complex subunit 2
MAIGSYLYSLKVNFEDGKQATWIGVGGYFGLQGVLWCWKRWVEKGQVFNGKRRRMVKRVCRFLFHITP